MSDYPPGLLATLKEHRQTVERLEAEVERLRAEIDQHKEDYEKMRGDLESDRDSETRWACQYKYERDKAQAEVERLTRELENKQADCDVFEGERDDAGAVILELEYEVERLRRETKRRREVLGDD